MEEIKKTVVENSEQKSSIDANKTVDENREQKSSVDKKEVQPVKKTSIPLSAPQNRNNQRPKGRGQTKPKSKIPFSEGDGWVSDLKKAHIKNERKKNARWRETLSSANIVRRYSTHQET